MRKALACGWEEGWDGSCGFVETGGWTVPVPRQVKRQSNDRTGLLHGALSSLPPAFHLRRGHFSTWSK